MSIKLVCIALALHYAAAGAAGEGSGAGPAGDELLEAMAGARGGCRLSVCMVARGAGGGARCAAAAWRRRWAVARASCVLRRGLQPARALRLADGLACDDSALGPKASLTRAIRSVRAHPGWRGGAGGDGRYDLVLLTLDRPFEQLDFIANTTTVGILLKDYKLWMAEMYMESLCKEKTQEETEPYIEHGHLFSSPLVLLLTTIVLPAGGLLAAFLFVIVCTGEPLKVPPYSNIENVHKIAPCLKTEYTLRVKC